MKVSDVINYGLLLDAEYEDLDATHEIIDAAQASWDAGDSYLVGENFLDSFFAKRESDTDEEKAAFAENVEAKLISLVLEKRLNSLGWKKVQELINSLYIMGVNNVTLYGKDVNTSDISSTWNRTHAEQPVYITEETTGFSI